MQPVALPVSDSVPVSSSERWYLTKHEGLGNDFLVLLDPDGSLTVDGERAREVCDRRRGVGADGLLHARPVGDGDGVDGADVDAVMVLFNADGSRAEMSGNGVRCFAQALLLGGWARSSPVRALTDAGLRTVTDVGNGTAEDEGDRAGQPMYSVDMGRVECRDAPEWALGPTVRAAWADAGNPHLVLEVPDVATGEAVDLVELGEQVNSVVDGGANVHLVAPGSEPAQLVMRPFERGVGPTEACGTGACAVGTVAQRWGMGVPDGTGALEICMPGGAARVVPGDPVLLIGPARLVAAVTYPWV